MERNYSTLQTRIGKIIQAEKIPSLTGARDIGGAIVTRTGRIVIAASISDGELNHPYKIVVTDDRGKSVREVFSMPASEKVTYHTLGITYCRKHHVIVSLFGRNDGYVLLDRPYGEMLPVSPERVGNNDSFLVISRDDGETWQVAKQLPLPKPQHSDSLMGSGVEVGGELFFPHLIGTTNAYGNQWRFNIYLARLRFIPKKDGSFECDYDPQFRTIATNSDEDVPFSCETIYLSKVDGSGYIAFVRNGIGAPYRREYDLNHNPICEFERCRAVGFDKRDYDHGHNGPKLIAFGVIRMADGNLLYSSRFDGTEHHRPGDIFMTSTDEGKTWVFADDYIPWTISPLEFSNAGNGGNPQMDYASDGTLVHLTSEGCIGGKLDSEGHVSLDPPPKGGYALCCFEGITVRNEKSGDSGTITIDISTITRIEKLFLARITIVEREGIETEDENENLHKRSADGTQVSFAYKKVGPTPFVCVKVVLANTTNPYRPIFNLRINIDE